MSDIDVIVTTASGGIYRILDAFQLGPFHIGGHTESDSTDRAFAIAEDDDIQTIHH